MTDRAVLRRDALYRRALVASDLISAAIAVVTAMVILGDDKLTPALLAAVPVVVLISKVLGLYDRDQDLLSKTTLEEAPTLFYVATLYTLLFTWLGHGLLFEGSLGREQLLGVWALLFLFMTISRALSRSIVTRVAPPERCLVLGSSASTAHVREKLGAGHWLNAIVVGRVALEPDPDDDGPALGAVDSLGVVLAQHEVQRVIIAPMSTDTEHLLQSIRLVKALGVKVSVLPRLFEVIGSSVRLDEIHGMTLLGIPRYEFTKSSQLLKRSFDLVVGALALIAAAPLLLIISAAIKLSSSGPLVFRQARIGRDGRQFEMLKFRSMVEGAEAQKAGLEELNEAGEGLFKVAADPRVTRVGSFLRRTSLDELPQLVNVLKGEMSLVGPRPLVPEDDRHIQEGWQRGRLHAPPGMTGVWQVLGSSRIPLHEMVKIDYLYCTTWSLWLDLKILLRTGTYVFNRRGV